MAAVFISDISKHTFWNDYLNYDVNYTITDNKSALY